MKKQSLRILLVSMLCVAPSVQGQLVWQRVESAPGLAAGTSSSLVAVNNAKAYSYVETIYDKDLFSLTEGALIDTVWFYCTAVGTPTATDATFELRLTTTTKDKHTALRDWIASSASATFADTNIQPTTTGWFPIKLATPFDYNGTDNLVVAIYRNGSGGTGQTYSALTDVTSRITDGYTNDAAWSTTKTGPSGRTHMADIRLSVRAPRINRPVENLATTATTQTSATVGWDVSAIAKEPIKFKIEYGPRGFAEGTGTVLLTADASSNSYTIESLSAAMWYDVYVSAVCGVGDTSASRNVSLATACEPKSLPWAWSYTAGQLSEILSWTGSDELPLCWDFPNQGANSTSYPQFIVDLSGSSPMIGLRATNGNPAVAVLPEFNVGLGHSLLGFYVDGVATGLDYGYVTDASSASSFVLLGQAEMGMNYVDLEELGLEVPGSARLAFRLTEESAIAPTVLVKDIMVQVAPSCKRPGAISVDEALVTRNSVGFSWGGVLGDGNTYRLKVVKKDATDTVVINGLTVQSYNLTSYQGTPLEAGTYYEVYVDKLCGGSYTERSYRLLQTLGIVNVSVSSACSSMGTVSGLSEGREGSTGYFSAVANPHYHFVEWSDGNTDNPRGIMYRRQATAPTYVASFAINTHTINFVSNNETYGTVTNATGSYAWNSTASSTATPNPGYVFAGWSDGTTTATINHSVSADNTLTAYFVPDGSVMAMATLRNNITGYSIVQTPADGIVMLGQTVSVTVTAADENGYYNLWNTPPTTQSHTPGTLVYEATFTAGSENAIYVFNNNPQPHTLTLTVNDGTLGEVSGASAMMTTYFGDPISIFAQPNAHCKFVGWTGYQTTTTNPLEFDAPAENVAVNAVFRRDSITVHLSCADGGTVRLAYGALAPVEGTDVNVRVAVGDDYTITATRLNEHYSFFQWSDGAGTASRTLTAAGNDGTTTSFSAVFSPEVLTITATSNVGECTVTGGNNYAYNSTATLEATPSSHYNFVRWSQGGSEVSTAATYAFTVLSAGSYEAEFSPKTYTITATTENPLRGSVSGSGSYTYNTTVNLSATPELGWAFAQWSDGNTDNPRIFAAAEDMSVTAQFEQEVYHLTLNVVNGTITDEATIEAADYHYGDVVTLAAVNADPVVYRWAGWSDGGAQSHTYTVTASATLTATFTPMDRYSVNVSANNDSYGTYAKDAADYTSVQTAEVRATANAGYRFSYWTNIPLANKYDNPLRIAMGEHDTTIQAVFVPERYTVSTSVNNSAWGTIAGGGAFDYNSMATLTAIPMPGYRVDSWSTGTSRNFSQTNVVVASDVLVSVVFCPDTFTVSAQSDHAAITMTYESTPVVGATGSFAYGSLLNISAVADANYTGAGWSDGVASATRTIIVGNSDATYVYYTNINQYTITGESDDPAMGYVTGSDTRSAGQQTTLVAHANPHYVFVRWNDNETADTRVETFTSNRSYTAYFAIEQHSISLAGSDASLGEVAINGGGATGVFDYGTVITLRARANAGVRFVRWAEDGNTDTVRTYIVGGDATLTAVWDSIEYTLDTMSNNIAMGHISVVPAKPFYRYGESVVLSAEVSNAHLYRFVAWSDGVSTATHPAITFNSDQEVRLSAIFDEKSHHLISVVPNNDSWGATTGSATGLTNGVYTVTATPLHDYVEFLGWSDNGSAVSPRDITISDNDFVAMANFGLKNYTVTSVDATSCGTSQGAGSYAYGTMVTLYANANANYVFRSWSNGATQNPYTFVIDRDTIVNPIFTLDSVDIAIVATNVDAVVGVGRYAVGASVSLGVTPSDSYHVGMWTLNGTTVASGVDALPSFYATANATYVVSVERDQRTLSVSNAHTAMGYVDGVQLNTLLSLDHNTLISLTATPNAHHEFAGWVAANGDTVSHNANFAFNLTADTNLTACFRATPISVSVVSDDVAMGNVTGSDANGNYVYGDVFTAVATPEVGYVFKHWTPGSITTNPYTFQVQANTALTAVFEAATYTLAATPNDPTMGTVSRTPSQANYNYGDTVNVSVSYDANRYRFVSWSNGDTRESFDTVVKSNVELIAIFNDAQQKNVTLFANGNGSAVASASSVYSGTAVTITATPSDTNTYFVGWSNGLTDASTTITVTSDTLLTATFLPKQRMLDVLVAGRGTVAHNATYAHGSTVTLVAEPDAHAHFMYWDNGSNDPRRVITMDSSINLTALFANDSVNIQAAAVNGTVSIADTMVSYDSVFLLTATPAAHYSHFRGWTRNGVAVSGAESILVDAHSDGYYVATFDIDTVSLIVAVNSNAMGSVTGAVSGQYPYGTHVQMTATPALHHHFVGWMGNPQLTSATIDTILTTNTALTALFELDSFDVSATADATLHFGTASIDGVRTRFGYGEQITLRARPQAEMYRFVGWSDGSNDTVRVLTITSALNLVASFDTIWYDVTLISNAPTMGNVLGRAGRYYHGDTLHAAAIVTDSSLYQFNGWNTGSLIATMDTVITSNVSLIAYFGTTSYTLTIVSADVAMGSVSGSGVYPLHSLVTIEAMPNVGHSFVMWSDGVTAASRQVYVERDSILTAYFAINRHTVSVNINDTAMGSVSGAGIYVYGDTATLVAHPALHHEFAGFNGGSAAIDSISFVVTNDTTINADFVRSLVKLYTHSEHGTLEVTAGGLPANLAFQPVLVYHGDSVSLRAIADTGYHFENWVEYNVSYDTVADSVLVIDSLVVDTSYVDPDGEHITIYDTIAHYELRKTVNMQRTPLDTLSVNPMAYLATADRYVEAIYGRNSYNVLLSGLNASLSGDSTYLYGDSATVFALCDSHYHFVAWLDTIGDTVSLLNPYTFAVGGETHLVAVTALDLVTVTLTASVGGQVIGAGDYEYGSLVTIIAQADSGYYFTSWSDGDTNATRQVTLTSDTTFAAVFYRLGIRETNFSDVNIYAAGRTIRVIGATNQSVRIFDAVGRQVATIEQASENLTIPVEATGVYMVQVGNSRARRVMIVR